MLNISVIQCHHNFIVDENHSINVFVCTFSSASSRLCGAALPRAFWGSMLWIQNGRRAGNAAEFTCHPGSVFVEGGSSRSVFCMPDGQWHSQVSVCKGRYCASITEM